MRLRAILLGLILVGLCAQPTMAAPALIQSAKNAGLGGDDALGTAYTSPTTVGDFLMAACSVYLTDVSATNAVFSDTQGNTWTVIANFAYLDGGIDHSHVYVAWAVASATTTPTVTCNPPGTNEYISLQVSAFSGIVTTSPLDQSVTATDGGTTSTAPNSGTTGTTVQADELLIGSMSHCCLFSAITTTAPLLQVTEEEGAGGEQTLAVGYRLLSSVGTFSAAWTLGSADNWGAGAWTFKAPVVATATANRRRVW
jgi:hypothetical protein